MQINRRQFIKGYALAGMAGLISPSLTAAEASRATAAASSHAFTFNASGKFKILQLTDTHYISGDPRSQRALDNVKEMLDTEKPDLVIHTGDIIFGEPAEESCRELLAPIAERHIPFAVAFGNHDDEFGKSRNEMLETVRSIPGNLNAVTPQIHGAGNTVLTIANASGEVERALYIIDSLAYSQIDGIKGYDHIRFDQVAWYQQQSQALAQQHNGQPVPSFAFFHIPLYEHKMATEDPKNSEVRGTRGEEICCGPISSGLFALMREQKDVQAIFCGHDHNNDNVTVWNGMFFVYGRYSGCDTVYNDLKPNGARVIELTAGSSSFRSWIRLSGGAVIQDLRYPDDFMRGK
ncbi:MAG: metallophosphoesterase family protein [Parabacteroides sp.]